VRLPLFPLHTVLFPEATLALQIFEPRYREMIGRCLAHDEPFGVVLILDGEEVGGPAVPRKVGTEASIIASERSKDGQYDIVVEGRRRFRILSLDRSRSYLRADVEFLEDPPGPDAASSSQASCKRSRPAAMLSLTRHGTSWTRDPSPTVSPRTYPQRTTSDRSCSRPRTSPHAFVARRTS